MNSCMINSTLSVFSYCFMVKTIKDTTRVTVVVSDFQSFLIASRDKQSPVVVHIP